MYYVSGKKNILKNQVNKDKVCNRDAVEHRLSLHQLSCWKEGGGEGTYNKNIY